MPRENPNALWEKGTQRKKSREVPTVRRLRERMRRLGVIDWDGPLHSPPAEMMGLLDTIEGIMRERGVTAQKALSIYSRRVHG